MTEESEISKDRLTEIVLDENTIRHINPDVAHERQVAIFDLLDENYFEIPAIDRGPYILNLSLIDNRLMFKINDENGNHLYDIGLSLSPLRKIIKDYFLVCESYYEAIKSAPTSYIESLDMGRRGLHNEGSEILMERLEGKVKLDLNTARRLFTLICALHWKG